MVSGPSRVLAYSINESMLEEISLTDKSGFFCFFAAAQNTPMAPAGTHTP